MPRRPDAELVKTTKFHELEFHIMHGRNESAIYFNTQIDLTKTLVFLEKYNKDKKENEKLTLFQIFLAACTRTVTLRPNINRFVSGRRLWQRNQIRFAFVTKKEKTEDGDEVNTMIEFDPYDTIKTVQKKVYEKIYEARHEENPNEKDINLVGGLPRWVIKLLFWFMRRRDEHNRPLVSITDDMPLWSTVFIAHLGSINVDAVYHHPFELGTNGIFIVIGKIKKAALVNQETDEIEVKKVMELRISIDDRIASGSYTGPTIAMLQELLENPEPLLSPPDLTDEQLDKLMLKKYKADRLAREKARKKENKSKKRK
ncbi:MAG: 2-oxo acid dehydrogenase subunit E2 [Candidatus Heimdallarchaeota archaeon]